MSADNTILMLINSTMKRKNILLILMIAFGAPWAAIADDLLVANSTGTNSTVPIYGTYTDDNYQHTQTIYPASMLTQMQGGSITKLTYYLQSAGTDAWGATFEVRLGTTTQSSFSSGTVSYISMTGSANYTGVIDNTNSNALIEITLSTPYTYNSGNLVVDFRLTSLGSDYQGKNFYGESGSTYYSIQSMSTSSVPNSTGSAVSFMPKTQFTYTPAPITMTCGTTYSGTLGTSGIWNNYPGCTYNDEGEEKIYAFTPTVSGSHTFHGNVTSGDPDFWLLSTPDNTGTNLIGSCWNSGDKTVSLTAGTTVYLIVDNYSNSNSAGYSVSVTCPTTYTVTYNANGGTGTMTDSNSPYVSGSTVTVLNNAFTAPSGKTFSGWNTAADGSGTSYDPNDTFNISANTTLYAQWAISVCTPTWGSSNYGYISNFTVTSSGSTLLNSSSTGTTNSNTDYYNSRSFTVAAGSEISCSITPSGSSTYGFAIWMDMNNNGLDSGDRVLYTSSYSSSFSNQTYTIPANTSPGEYRVRILQDWSTKTPSDPCGSYYYGESEDYKLIVTAPLVTHTITATADPTTGGTVSFMTGPANSTTARTHLPIDSYRNYSFSQQIYTPDEVGGGTISSISLYSVDGNLNDGVDFTRTLAVYMAHTDKTEFSSTSDWISNSDSPDMALVYSGNVTFVCGEWNTINFTNSFNYDGTRNLVLIIADNTGTSAPAGNYLECKTFTPSSGGYCSLNHDTQFNPSSPSGNGERLTEKNQILINPGSSDSRDFPEGASCTLVATPNDGYRFVDWTENNSTVGNSTTYTISNIQADHDLVAHFERDSYTLTTSANPSAGGTVSPSGNNTYTPGTSVQLSATANTGYSFTNWTENGSVLSSNANYTITMNADHTVVANFTQNNYTISYSPTSSNPSNGCYISGNTSAHYGDNITVTLHVATGYELRSITAIDGNNNTVTLTGSGITDGSTYTFSMPASNVTVTAEFKRACMVPTNLAESTTINSATITWDDSYGSEWQVAHATSSSANPDNNIISPNVTEQTYTMGNLTLGSTHYFWVRSYCSVSEQSAWVGPVEVVIECTAPGSTLSATATSTGAVLTWTGGTGEGYTVELGTPTTSTVTQTVFSEDFEGGSLPSSWTFTSNNTVNDIGGTGTNPAGVYSTAAYNGSSYGFRFSSYSSASDYNQYLVSPQVSLNSAGELTFYFKKYNTSTEELYVGYSTSNNSLSSFTWTENLVPTASWQSYTLSLPSNTKYIAFHYFGSFTYYVYLDDISITTSTTTTTTIWTEVANDATSPYTITGCNIGTTYKARVKDQCNNVSNEVDFTPDCTTPTNVTASNLTINSAHISWDGEADSYNVRYATATITGTTLDPVFEDGFEDGIGSWTTYANGYSNEVTNWRQYDATNFSSGGVTNHTGNYVAMSRSYDGSLDRSVDNWLVSPQMTLGDVVKFWVCGDDAGWQEYYEVYVSTGTNAVSDFELVEAPALAPSDGTWAERTVDLSAYAGQQGYVAIRHTDTGKDYLLIDDFGVYNTVNSYSYGTWQTVTPSPTTTSCDINGLSAETLYAVQVQADCGTDGTSSWGSVYFTTPDACGAPTNLVSSNITATTATLGWADNQDSYNVRYRKVYFYEGFEGETLPTGWTTIDANNDGLTWGTGHATAHSGHNGAYNVSYVYNTTGTTPNDYLVSPQLDLQGTLRVWLSGYERQSSNYSEHFEILLSTTGTSASDFTTTLVGETTTTNSYVEYTADLSSYSGQGYIAIHHFNCSDQYYLYVDDFGIYGSENWVSVTPNPTDATTTLTGLTANTTYEWQVQGINCDGNGHTTDWSATANFTTLNGYIVTATAEPSGSGTFAFTGSGVASSNATSAVVNPNGDVTVTATATAGYTFMNWIEGGSVVSTTNAYALTGVNASHDLIAHFVDMTASNTWPAAVTTLAAATPGYSVDGSTVTISNANGLAWLISTVNGLNGQSGTAITSSTVINLTADVDMSAHIWVPIGTTEHPFVGTFNGNGHTISGVNRALEFPNQGVFGYVSGGTIHDVVVNTNITGDCNYMGSVAGTLASGTVYNTGSTGTVTANANTIAVGGTVGYNGGLVHSSFATGTFTGLAGDYVGGLVGENAPAGRLYNSYSNATLTGGNRGGLVGYNKGTAANCYNVNNSATYAYANINAGTMEYVYSDNTNNSYYNTIEGSPTLQYHGSSFSSVQSDIKHLDYMYRDNVITLAGGQTNSYVPSSVSYDNNHTVKWNGLVSALNQWVADNKTSGVNISDLSSWYRPHTTNINGDLPVLGFGGETTLGAADGSHKTLKYGTMDDLLTTYNNSTASIFHYGKATEVTHVPTANVNVYIDEDAVLLQATSPDPGDFINTTVGVTFDNSDHGTHAYDYWGNKLNYDWHFMSTPLSDAKIGATYNDYVAHGFGSDIDIKALVNSYFPNGLPMTLHDENWRWDFYTYYEPEYHWINMKRNKNNHYHVDGGGSISYTYVADDQAVGDEASLACVFTPGKGYMLAISKDVFMNSTGTLNRGNVPIRLTLKEPDDINYASGWNLVGNPYQAYLNINSLNRNLYIYDADQGVYAPYAPAASGNPATPSQYIHPHQAFFVHAASDGEELIFTQAMASTETTPYSYYRDDRIDYPLVNLYAENNAGQRDLTVVEFHRPELGGARKLETMRNAPFTIAAHYAGMSYGILFATDDIERIPVRFKTDESGWVTLTWSTHNGVFSKLLLIDNKLGVEHNMLADNSYTFEASPDDYSSRFYIVYDCSGMGIEENEDDGGASTGSATFAYINNGNIVIDVDTGHGASIQVIDVLGRVLYSKTIAGTDGTSCTISTKGLAKGVYLIRLADGHNVKTQKLVVQ